jgi:hypothetical protein
MIRLHNLMMGGTGASSVTMARWIFRSKAGHRASASLSLLTSYSHLPVHLLGCVVGPPRYQTSLISLPSLRQWFNAAISSSPVQPLTLVARSVPDANLDEVLQFVRVGTFDARINSHQEVRERPDHSPGGGSWCRYLFADQRRDVQCGHLLQVLTDTAELEHPDELRCRRVAERAPDERGVVHLGLAFQRQHHARMRGDTQVRQGSSSVSLRLLSRSCNGCQYIAQDRSGSGSACPRSARSSRRSYTGALPGKLRPKYICATLRTIESQNCNPNMTERGKRHAVHYWVPPRPRTRHFALGRAGYGPGGGVKMAWVPMRRQMTWAWPAIRSSP